MYRFPVVSFQLSVSSFQFPASKFSRFQFAHFHASSFHFSVPERMFGKCFREMLRTKAETCSMEIGYKKKNPRPVLKAFCYREMSNMFKHRVSVRPNSVKLRGKSFLWCMSSSQTPLNVPNLNKPKTQFAHFSRKVVFSGLSSFLFISGPTGAGKGSDQRQVA